jgi:hypothetical protein
MCVYMCSYVSISLCVFWLGFVEFGVRRVFWTQGYFGHFASRGNLVILLRIIFSA